MSKEYLTKPKEYLRIEGGVLKNVEGVFEYIEGVLMNIKVQEQIKRVLKNTEGVHMNT